LRGNSREYNTLEFYRIRGLFFGKGKSMTKKFYVSGIGLLAVVLCVLSIASAQAATLYWNAPDGGDGDWDTSNTEWATNPLGSVDTIWNNGNNDDAVFQNAPGYVTIDSGGITVQNMTFNVDGYVLDLNTITLAGTTPTITVTSDSDTAMILSVLDGSAGMVKSGAGTLVLMGANNYSGGTTVSAGTLYLADAYDLLSTSGAITVTGGVLDFGGYGQTTSGDVSIQSGTIQGGTITKSGSAYEGQAGTVSASLGGNVGLNKSTAGTLTLSAANTYNGGTTISDGTLALTGADNRLSTSGAITMTGGVLDLGTFSQTTTGAISIQNATLQNGTLVNNGSDLAVTDSTISAIIGGTGGLTKTGSGTLFLTATNTFTGKSVVYEGTVSTGNRNAFGANPSSYVPDQVTLYGGTTLQFTARWGSSPDGMGNHGITLVAGPGGDNVTIEYNVTSGSTGMTRFMARFTGNTSLTYKSVTNGTTYSGDIAVSGFWPPVNPGDLTTYPDPYNTYTGDCIVVDGTWLTTRGANSFPFGPGYGNLVMGDNTGINMNGTNQRVNKILGPANSYIGNWGNGREFVVGENDSTFQFDGGMRGTTGRIHLGKNGAGTATFTGDLSGSDVSPATNPLGGIRVYQGTLKFASTVTVGNGLYIIDVKPGATFDVTEMTALPLGSATQTAARNVVASGIITGNVSVVGASGFNTLLSPGTSPGTLTVDGNLTLDGFGGLNIEIGGEAAGEFDVLNVTGDINLLSDSVLNVSLVNSYVPVHHVTLDVLDWGGELSGTFSSVVGVGLPLGWSVVTDNLYTDGTISLVPEPGTIVLLLMGALLLLVYWRRR
jgi:autotransporter-associated beta strand protein